jgi:ketosteroid isomerase-like protein
MTTLRTLIHAGIILGVLVAGYPAAATQQTATDADQILAIHKSIIASHLKYDAEGVLAAEADDIILVSRGELLFPRKADRIAQFERYLGRVEFEEYHDLVDPIVRVSKDGTLGWLIAQVRISGTSTNSEGESIPFDWTWAWIELYEKRNGQWKRVGEVSNMKP